MSEHSRSEFEKRLVELAEENPEFRELLKSDPKKAITGFLKMELPEELRVEIHEEDENSLHFVLPPGEGQLTAAEMTSVSGGVCWSDCFDGETSVR